MSSLTETSGSLPSEFKDPFTHDSIDNVKYEFYKTKSFLRDDKFHKATVYLKADNTSGFQNFYDNDPEILRQKVENFINSLK